MGLSMFKSLSNNAIEKLLLFAYKQNCEKTFHITRLSMYKDLKGRLKDFDSSDKLCLSISDSNGLGEVLGLEETKSIVANYPEYQIQSLNFPDNSFDFCISDQVFEHIEGNPFKAFSETARILKRGGFVCHTTCFINEVHGAPKDFWRFTPDALSLMANECGLEVTVLGGWGNREVIPLMNSDFRFSPIPDDPANPIYELATKNEPDWPISTWIIAKKP
jgi:SAM-dependent methyltransferase